MYSIRSSVLCYAGYHFRMFMLASRRVARPEPVAPSAALHASGARPPAVRSPSVRLATPGGRLLGRGLRCAAPGCQVLGPLGRIRGWRRLPIQQHLRPRPALRTVVGEVWRMLQTNRRRGLPGKTQKSDGEEARMMHVRRDELAATGEKKT